MATQSNKSIPKKDFRESGNNFNSTHGVKSAMQLQPSHQNHSNMAAMSSNLHNMPNTENLVNSSNFASTGNVIMQNRSGMGKPPSN